MSTKRQVPNNPSSHLNLHDKELADLLEAVNLHCKKLTMLWGLVEDCEIKVNPSMVKCYTILRTSQNINETYAPQDTLQSVYIMSQADTNCGDLVLFSTDY